MCIRDSNCYLVFGEDKVALIDNVYPGTSAQLWGREMCIRDRLL